VLELTTKSCELSAKIIASLERLQGRGAWKRRLQQLEEKYGTDAYRSLFYILTHLDFTARQANTHWKKLLEVWEGLDHKTGARLDLRVVVVHYFLKIRKKLHNPAIVEIKFLQKAEDSVILDELTRVYNYRYFQHRIELEIKRVRRYGHGMSLLMIDVDDFKWFNDHNGHLAGNDALKKLAGILKKCFRDVDVVCRYGGEEFAVILPTTLKNGALTAAEKARLRIARARFAGGDAQPLRKVTVSIGVATVPSDATDPAELVARADAALYRAKAFGKNRVEAFSDERRECIRFDVAVEGKLAILDKTPVTFTTSNVSQGGLLFRSRQHLTVGGIVQLELQLTRDSKAWNCTGRVARVEEANDAYDIGVKIIHVEGAEIFEFNQFLATLQQQSRASDSSLKKRAG